MGFYLVISIIFCNFATKIRVMQERLFRPRNPLTQGTINAGSGHPM